MTQQSNDLAEVWMNLRLLQARVPALAEPIDLTVMPVQIREEPIEDVVPETPVWDRETVDEEEEREAFAAAPDPNAEVVPAAPITMVLRDGFLQGPGEWTLMDDLDVALSTAMTTADTRAVQVAPLVPILDFAEEEALQARLDRRRGTEQMDAEADRLVREGRAPVEYVEQDAEDQPPLDEYASAPEYTVSE